MAGFRSEHRSQNQGSIKTFDLPPHWTWADTIHRQFDSADELVEVAARAGSLWTSERVSRKRDKSLGTESWEEALDLARYGWTEGRNHLVKQTGIYAHQIAAPAKGWQYDYAGAFPDVPRFLGGDVDCMVDVRPESLRHRQIVRMVVSPITFSDVVESSIRNWGAALVSWIDELERSGRRVEVVWLSCSEPSWGYEDERRSGIGGPCVAISFCLKAADQPVELDRLAFWIMHPAAQRRMQFAVKEQMDIEKWYKETCGVPVSDLTFLKKTFGRPAMVFSVEQGAVSVEVGINSMKRQADAYLAVND